MTKPEVYISYSTDEKSCQTTDNIHHILTKNKLQVITDKIGIEYKGNLKQYMQELGAGKAIIVVISDAYLKSENCMYQMLEIHKNKNMWNRIFPIVLPDAKIYNDIERIDYINFWDDKINQLNKKIKTIDNHIGISKVISKMDEYGDIRRIIDEITDMLRDMKTLTPSLIKQNGYDELVISLFKYFNIKNTDNDKSLNAKEKSIFNNLNLKKIIFPVVLFAIISTTLLIVKPWHHISLSSPDILEQINTSMILVKGGTFEMGSNKGIKDEIPMHLVVINDFYISNHELTEKEYYYIINNKKKITDSLPISNISWYQAIEYCNLLSKKAGLDQYYKIDKKTIDPDNYNDKDTKKWTIHVNSEANGYRLPTEAEWEYAALGGNKSTAQSFSFNETNKLEYAWLLENSENNLNKIAKQKPNILKLYDMLGNASEWCFDWYDLYPDKKQFNPKGANFGRNKIHRGGAYNTSKLYLNYKTRDYADPFLKNNTIGMRLVRNK